MSESQEIVVSSQERDPETYLTSIGEDNKRNVSTLRDALMQTTKKLGISGFMLAVGGTVVKEQPDKRKDVDVRVGFDIDNSDLVSLPLLERYQKQFQRWQEVVGKAVGSINEDESFGVETDPPHPDPEHEWMAANDGMVKVIPKNGGVPIEILCHQTGARINPPFVTLFNNLDSKVA